jgi:hypothetical protein
LVDVVIAVAILGIIAACAYPGFLVVNNTITTSGRRDLTERAGDQILKEVVGEIRAGLLSDVELPPNAPSVTTLRPRTDVTLDELTSESEVPWDGQARVLRFRQTGTIKESDEGEDINKDGDQSDSFATGLLELTAGGSTRPLLTRAEVILGLPNYDGDLDGDGNADPMFEVEDRRVTVRIFLVNRGDGNRVITTGTRTTVHLRNQQE